MVRKPTVRTAMRKSKSGRERKSLGAGGGWGSVRVYRGQVSASLRIFPGLTLRGSKSVKKLASAIFGGL